MDMPQLAMRAVKRITIIAVKFGEKYGAVDVVQNCVVRPVKKTSLPHHVNR